MASESTRMELEVCCSGNLMWEIKIESRGEKWQQQMKAARGCRGTWKQEVKTGSVGRNSKRKVGKPNVEAKCGQRECVSLAH